MQPTKLLSPPESTSSTQTRLLDAAERLIVKQGWQRTRMLDIATEAGLSRRTAFNEFGSKAGVLQGIAWRNMQRFAYGALARVEARGDDIVAGITSATDYLLRTAAADPVFRAVLVDQADQPDEVQTLVTTRSGPFITAATAIGLAVFKQRWPSMNVDEHRLSFAVESILRLLVSHVVQPADEGISQTAENFGWLASRILGADSD